MNTKNILKLVCFYLFTLTNISKAQNFEWAKAFGGTGSDNGASIITDPAGNVYTTGYFHGTVDFNPSPTETYNLTAIGSSTFITKFDVNGNFIWAKHFESTDGNFPTSIALDNNNNIYTTGHFYGTVDFHPDSGIFNLTSAGQGDIYISKLDTNGNFIAAIRLGSTSTDIVNAICLDASNNMYIIGQFEGTVDFDPGSGVQNLTSTGNYPDIFILKLNDSGGFFWVKKLLVQA